MSIETNPKEYKSLVISRFRRIKEVSKQLQAVGSENVRIRDSQLPKDWGIVLERANLSNAVATVTLTLFNDMKDLGLEDLAREIANQYSKPQQQQPAA